MEIRQGFEFNSLDEDFLGDQETENHPRKLRKPIMALLITSIFGLGITFAANIVLTRSSSVEFGQGIEKITSCGPVTLIPYTSFDNSKSILPSNSMIYGWTGDGLTNGGQGSPNYVSKLGYSQVFGVAGVANYVEIKGAAGIGSQTPGIPDPGNLNGTHGGYITLTGYSQAKIDTTTLGSAGTIAANGLALVVNDGNPEFTFRITTPFSGTLMINIYRYLGNGVYSSSPSESVAITVGSASLNPVYDVVPFKMTGFSVTNLSSDCWGKDFDLKAFDDSSSNPLGIFMGWPGEDAKVRFDSTTSSAGDGYSGFSVAQIGNSGFKVDFTTPLASTLIVKKLTLESMDRQ